MDYGLCPIKPFNKFQVGCPKNRSKSQQLANAKRRAALRPLRCMAMVPRSKRPLSNGRSSGGNVEFSHGKWWKIAESHKILQLFFGWLKHVKTCFLWAFIHNGMFFAAFSTGFYAGSLTPEALTQIQGHQCSLRSSNAATNKKNPTCQRPLRSVLNKCWDSWKSYSYIMLHIVYWDPHSRNDT